MTDSILALTAAPATTRLTTLERVRADLSLDAADADDATVDRLIDTASALIATYLGQRRDDSGSVSLARADFVETFRIGADAWYIGADAWRVGARGAPLVLARTPIGAIASVAENGAETPALIEDPENPGETIANPAFAYEADKPAGLLWKLSAGYRVGFCASEVAVAYSAGWILPSAADGAPAPTLPADIEAAAVITCLRLLQRNQDDVFGMLDSASIPGLGSWKRALQKVDWVEGVPSDAAAMLKPYRRLAI